MKKTYLIIVIAVLAIFTWLTIKPHILEPKSHTPQVEIGDKIINVEIANTNAKRELGLSGHAPLADVQGMLFVFDKSGIYPFWMKDMLFPIDIIWISEDFKIVYIEKNAQINSFPNTFGYDKEARYVLEVNAGFSDNNNLKIGDQVKF
jgi:uncharacterized membrane protein (UPF0127 family)